VAQYAAIPICSFNADMRPDLLTVGTDGHTVVWQSGVVGKNFTKLNFTKSIDLEVPHSSAFIDLDRDYNAGWSSIVN